MSLNKQRGRGLFDKKKILKAKDEITLKLKRNFNYELRFYQTFPAFYLKNIAPNQKGLLINHLMGTGKTFTGINFITDYPDKKVLIVCPTHLKSNWINEIDKLGANVNNITFLNYDMFIDLITKIDKKVLENYILLLDEGHHLIFKIRYQLNEDTILNIYDKSKHFYKILFLSGTPFYNDEYDIIYIMNLVSGETLLPFNKSLFKDEYFKKSILKSGAFGYINPILESKATLLALFGTFIMLYVDGVLKYMEINTKTSKINSYNYEKMTNEINDLESKPGYQFIKKYLNMFGLGDALDPVTPDKTKIGLAPLIFITGMVIFTAIVYTVGQYDLNRIVSIDNKKLGDKIKNYISFYEIKNKKSIIKNLQIKKCHSDIKDDSYFLNSFCNSYLEKLENSDYPSKELIVKKIPYTKPQMKYFLKACYNRLTPEEILQLGIKQNIKFSEIYATLNEEDYLKYGRVIGNLTLQDNIDDKVSTFIPSKFNEILKISDNKQTVIYSNFYEKGILFFAKFLEDNNKIFKIINDNIQSNELLTIINEFKNKDIQYILLHPSLTEGISIIGAEQLHILEPLDTYANFDQITFRVVRYNSHTHLPLKERKVQIYQWINTTLPFISNFIEKIKGWKKFSPQVIFFKRLLEFNDSLSPDCIVYNKNIKTSKLFEEFTEAIKDYSIEACSVKNKNFNCDLPYSIREMFKE
jgi:superfamily II DNA or RNA helicase